ncbi:unnamed protein product [Arctia plantaginis]|uniref:Uncharacterized protein n=1 Tax=Arctia plantaginis TaxID=874455 RepID=A0A8S1AYB5_ARCPL|nr:unnamed protein product [Arctia plantaginis]
MLGGAYQRGGEGPVGQAVYAVMTHLKNKPMPSPTCPQLLQTIVTALFPQQREFNYPPVQCEVEEIPPITN